MAERVLVQDQTKRNTLIQTSIEYPPPSAHGRQARENHSSRFKRGFCWSLLRVEELRSGSFEKDENEL